MGQQQLLLIVLGVILVGVAVVLGIKYFGVGAESGAKDELVAHTVTIAAQAQEYAKRPKPMGGGGNDFTGFGTTTLKATHMDSTANGWYEATPTHSSSDNYCTIKGHPLQSSYHWTVTTIATDSSVVTTIQ
jgi:hypothetical protein